MVIATENRDDRKWWGGSRFGTNLQKLSEVEAEAGKIVHVKISSFPFPNPHPLNIERARAPKQIFEILILIISIADYTADLLANRTEHRGHWAGFDWS